MFTSQNLICRFEIIAVLFFRGINTSGNNFHRADYYFFVSQKVIYSLFIITYISIKSKRKMYKYAKIIHKIF